jgi:lysophospholipase L1-like esterase
MGDNALARFDRDVLSQPRADTVILMMGINDIGWPDTLLSPKSEPAPSAADVIAGYKQLIARAHGKGLRTIGRREPARFEGSWRNQRHARRAPRLIAVDIIRSTVGECAEDRINPRTKKADTIPAGPPAVAQSPHATDRRAPS